ncbi:hypothetical protein MMC28_008298 [Mycoblastus sanguinarius]|nr:hypothetical protein [Mycoblastus sanguinarius]
MSGLLRLLRSKWSPPAPTKASFAGKTVLITGSNTGLGFYAARAFLNLSASRVILAVRNTSKGEAARAQLEAQTGRNGVVSVLPLDMNSYTSIKAFVDRVDQDFNQIDVAVLNAGLFNVEHVSSPEGWEESLQVNTLSTTLLALLLLGKLRSVKLTNPSPLPHLVLVSSGSHTTVPRSSIPTPPDPVLSFVSTSPFNGSRQYAISKLLLMYTLKPLAAIATSSGGEPQVLVTSCCPGFCYSDLSRQYSSWYLRIFAWVFYSLFARSTEEGSRTIVSAATLGEEAQGGYWKNDQLMRPGEMVTSAEGKKIQEQVWKEIVDVLKTDVPEVEGLAALKT